MRKKIVAGNWKMNLDFAEAGILFSELLDLFQQEVHGDQEVVICPPNVYIPTLSHTLGSEAKIFIGAQNCHHKDSGAFTGEVSAAMLKSAGARYVIIGHSERRMYFHEDDMILAEKLDVALKNELIPIFCIGETLEQRNAREHFEVIGEQLRDAAFHLNEKSFGKVVIAYEPVWAIGTGLTASPEQAQEIHSFIRSEIAVRYNATLAQSISILYGGSCNPQNAPLLFAQKDIDGGLIGGASLKARDFTGIIKVFNS